MAWLHCAPPRQHTPAVVLFYGGIPGCSVLHTPPARAYILLQSPEAASVQWAPVLSPGSSTISSSQSQLVSAGLRLGLGITGTLGVSFP